MAEDLTMGHPLGVGLGEHADGRLGSGRVPVDAVEGLLEVGREEAAPMHALPVRVASRE